VEIPESIGWTRLPNNIDYSHAKNLQDKGKADAKMIQAIDCLPSKKTMTECLVKESCKPKTFRIVKPFFIVIPCHDHRGCGCYKINKTP